MRVVLAKWLEENPRARALVARLIAKVPSRIRLGRSFWDQYYFFRESERWTKDELQQWQLSRLRALLADVVQRSPHFRDRMQGANIDRIRDLQAFRDAMPAMDRTEFRSACDRMLLGAGRSRRVTVSRTSGTTGTALQFQHPASDAVREHAAICHQWARVGYEPGRSIRAEFRGLTSAGRVVEYFPEKPMVRFSILDLRADAVRYYADVARRERVDFFHGYPSALHLVAEQVLADAIRFPAPKGILLASEEVHPWQVERIREAFPESKLFAHYGCAERVVLAGWCEYREEYHVLPQYSIVEVDSVTSEIIGTNLFNDINPFIRYRLTDVAIDVSSEICPQCRRPYTPRIGTIGGRSEDYLYTSSRGWIPPALITHPLKGLQSLQELRFLQSRPDSILLEYTLRSARSVEEGEAEVALVRKNLKAILGESATLEAQRVDGFERSASGKFKWIVNTMEECRSDTERVGR